MARPRKDSDRPEARQRLHDAFWALLETNELHEITVGIIASRAECNRGTFYYHYHDIDELIACAIQEEFLRDNAVPTLIFYLVTGVDQRDFKRALDRMSQRIYRLSLLLDKGGMDEVYETVKNIIIRMWQTILCADGCELTKDARLVVEYSVNGMLGMLTYEIQNSDGGNILHLSGSTFSDIASFMLTRICEAQGVDKQVVLARIEMISQLNGLAETH